jgi:hypothetical protein
MHPSVHEQYSSYNRRSYSQINTRISTAVLRQCPLTAWLGLECMNEGQNPGIDLYTQECHTLTSMCTLHSQQQTSDFQSNCMERWMLHVTLM